MTESWVYLTATVVGVCAVILVITLSVIICWLIVYCKHAKVRARKANHSSPKWKDPSILSTVSVETKPRHAKTYHDQTFRPNAAMDTSGVYIFGVSGTLSGTLRGESASRQGTVSSTTSSKYRESNT